VEQIVFPEDLKDLFRQELLRVSFEDLRGTYWEWPIQKYSTRIGITPEELVQLVRQSSDNTAAQLALPQLIYTSLILW